jgi:hypothetical protein
MSDAMQCPEIPTHINRKTRKIQRLGSLTG